MRKPGRRFAAGVLGLVACAVTRLAAADLDCTQAPNDLCAGGLCLLTGNVMQANCTIDFGNRNVVIFDKLVVPEGGTLSLKGGTMAVDAPIVVANPRANGATVMLESLGTFTTKKDIDVSGAGPTRSITLKAVDDLTVKSRLHAGGNLQNGGTVTLTSTNGRITVGSTSQFAIDVQGGPGPFAGGTVTVSAQSHVMLDSGILANGITGGFIGIGSTTGAITTASRFRVNGITGNGGGISMAAENFVLGDRRKTEFSARGGPIGDGGTISLFARTGDIVLDGTDFDVRGVDAGGMLDLTSNAAVLVGGPRRRSNRFDVSSLADAGTIKVKGAKVTIARRARLKARAAPIGIGVQGTITVDTLAGHGLGITTAGRFDVRPGGTIKIDSDAPITLLRGTALLANPGGCNEVQSPAITEEDPIRVLPAFVPAC